MSIALCAAQGIIMSIKIWQDCWRGSVPAGNSHHNLRETARSTGGIIRGYCLRLKTGRTLQIEGLFEQDAKHRPYNLSSDVLATFDNLHPFFLERFGKAVSLCQQWPGPLQKSTSTMRFASW